MDSSPDTLLLTNDLLIAIDVTGVFVMGIVGGALARRMHYDLVGFVVLGIISGLGGGLLRDLILNAGVPAAFNSSLYLTASLGGVAIAFVAQSEARFWRHATIILDCVAMGLWAAIGCAKSLGYGLDPLPAILLGVVSAVGGGVIRDVVVGRIPVVFGGPIYATAALLTSVLTWGIYATKLPGWTVIIAAAIGSLWAIISAWRSWSLPSAPDLSVTLSPTQLRALIRRAKREERARVAKETGAIPVVSLEHDALSDDAAAHPPAPHT